MGTAFIGGKAPMIVSGSWWYGRFDERDQVRLGLVPVPRQQVARRARRATSGSSPTSSKAKDLAYDFIDITMRPEIQALLGNNGGIPVAADASKITDPKNQKLIENFNTISEQDGLAFYPDWPVPGYYDVLVSGFQCLINQSKTPDQVLDAIASPYDEGVKEITGRLTHGDLALRRRRQPVPPRTPRREGVSHGTSPQTSAAPRDTARQRRPEPARTPRQSAGCQRRRPYWLYLLPGAIAVRARHRRAAGRHRLPVADQVVRRRRPDLHRVRQLHASCSRTRCSGRRSRTPSR